MNALLTTLRHEISSIIELEQKFETLYQSSAVDPDCSLDDLASMANHIEKLHCDLIDVRNMYTEVLYREFMLSMNHECALANEFLEGVRVIARRTQQHINDINDFFSKPFDDQQS